MGRSPRKELVGASGAVIKKFECPNCRPGVSIPGNIHETVTPWKLEAELIYFGDSTLGLGETVLKTLPKVLIDVRGIHAR